MRRLYWVLIGITAALVLVYIYILIARPVLVLPMVTYVPQENTALRTYQQQLNINQLDARIRTDGKVYVSADGKELGYVTYNPTNLGNAVALAEKYTLPPNAIAALHYAPAFVPGLPLNLILVGSMLYSGLPVEITVRSVIS